MRSGNEIKNRIISFVMALTMISLMLTGCQKKEAVNPDSFKIFYVNNSETGIMAVDYEIKSDKSDIDAVIAELIEQHRSPGKHTPVQMQK